MTTTTTNQYVSFPPRYAVDTRLHRSRIQQLQHGWSYEQVEVTSYNHRSVRGYLLTRLSGEQVLVAAKPTSSRPADAVLVSPDLILSTDSNLFPEGFRWIDPLPIRNTGSEELQRLAALARNSWRKDFRFIEETRQDDAVIKEGLRPLQMGALFASLAHWKVTNDIATVVMPTGTGKTETMLALLAYECPEVLLVIVPTAALRNQIADKFLTLGLLSRFGVISSEAKLPLVGRMEHRFNTPEEAQTFLACCNVVVATMSVVNACPETVQNALAERCTQLFIDEAHHVGASTWNAFRERVEAQERPILQFTATPFRNDGKHIGGKSIFTYPLRKAQEEGYFTPITFISLWEYNRDQADLAIAQKAVEVLRTDLQKTHDHLMMARVNTIERAQEVHALYNRIAPDLNPQLVHSKQTVSEKASALGALKTRVSKIIVCVDMLGEGFDLPQLKIAALHDIHKSLAVTLQFAGRFTRTASGLGEATIIANAADADVELALEDLYAKDADWNQLLRRLSFGATTRQQKRSEFIDGFQNPPHGLSLYNVFPRMSTVVFRTSCDNWQPNRLNSFLEGKDLIVEPTVNPTERVVLYIKRLELPVKWGQTDTIHDVEHEFYLAHWDENQGLLFINSTNNKSYHQDLADTLTGDNAELISGEIAYRSLHKINRLVLTNLGLLHQINRSNQFTMHVGSDIKAGLSRAAVDDRKKSNLFGRGYENGESVTIGVSHKGRVWSYLKAEDISEWVSWCQRIGSKLLDKTISTQWIIEQAITPEVITNRPPDLVPLFMDWPIYFLARNEEAVLVEVGGQLVPFYQASLEITSRNETGPIDFRIVTDSAHADYELVFEGNDVSFKPVGTTVAYITTSGQRKTLTDWFKVEPPQVYFADTSLLIGNEILRPKKTREPYNLSAIESWTWSGVKLTQESQYKAESATQSLVYRPESIQRHVINQMLTNYGGDYDIVFDDDDSGEIADIIGVEVDGDYLQVHLYHCKFSKSTQAGVRVGDFYEVCGQAQKSVRWRQNAEKMFRHLKLREMGRQKKYSISRFEKGDLQKLDELRRRSRHLYPKFHVYIVQPGLRKSGVSSDVLELLGATELYLQETFAVPMTVISSP